LVWIAFVQVFVLSLMASSGEIHERLHQDSHDTNHYCLCTDFHSGTIDVVPPAPILVPECAEVEIACDRFAMEDRSWLPAHLFGSLLEHGPPAFA